MIEWLVQQRFFRNANHAIWFTSSVVMLLVVMLITVFPDARWVYGVPIIFHTSPLLTSIYKVHIKHEDSSVYSRDCIWFNACMVIAYAVWVSTALATH